MSDPVVLRVRVIPRARRTELAGRRGDALLVRLAAPPVDGAANAALLAFLSQALGIPRGQIALLRGETSRDKALAITGLAEADLRARLGLV